MYVTVNIDVFCTDQPFTHGSITSYFIYSVEDNRKPSTPKTSAFPTYHSSRKAHFPEKSTKVVQLWQEKEEKRQLIWIYPPKRAKGLQLTIIRKLIILKKDVKSNTTSQKYAAISTAKIA